MHGKFFYNMRNDLLNINNREEFDMLGHSDDYPDVVLQTWRNWGISGFDRAVKFFLFLDYFNDFNVRTIRLQTERRLSFQQIGILMKRHILLELGKNFILLMKLNYKKLMNIVILFWEGNRVYGEN